MLIIGPHGDRADIKVSQFDAQCAKSNKSNKKI